MIEVWPRQWEAADWSPKGRAIMLAKWQRARASREANRNLVDKLTKAINQQARQ
jgi:hypothetical protein